MRIGVHYVERLVKLRDMQLQQPILKKTLLAYNVCIEDVDGFGNPLVLLIFQHQEVARLKLVDDRKLRL